MARLRVRPDHSGTGGVLVVGPPEVAAQVAAVIPRTIIFSIKDADMELSNQLNHAKGSDDTESQESFLRIDSTSLRPPRIARKSGLLPWGLP